MMDFIRQEIGGLMVVFMCVAVIVLCTVEMRGDWK